jgi:hypothetical protein
VRRKRHKTMVHNIYYLTTHCKRKENVWPSPKTIHWDSQSWPIIGPADLDIYLWVNTGWLDLPNPGHNVFLIAQMGQNFMTHSIVGFNYFELHLWCTLNRLVLFPFNLFRIKFFGRSPTLILFSQKYI